jgi:cytoskeletal protein CcmA (bactofilin family)
MWKKDEATPGAERQPEMASRAETPRPSSAASRSAPGELATIGRSITIKGEVSGDEDLLIQGRVDGSIDLDQQSVTVGREGRVKANITGRVVTVEGQVEGDLKAQEQVILRSSARVHGDITAPRVVLEDGASFRGLVDMGEPGAGKEKSGSTSDAKSSGSASASAKSDAASTSSSTTNGATTSPSSAAKDTSKTKDTSGSEGRQATA